MNEATEALPKFKVLFATDGDSAEIITDILTATDTNAFIYPVLHNCYVYPKEPKIIIILCLPAKKPGGGEKCLEVFQLKVDIEVAIPFLFHTKPLNSRDIQKYIDTKAARKTFKPILDIIISNKPSPQPHNGDIKSKIVWFRAKFVNALRKLYKISSSPYWMITTFGSFEVPFLLTAVFYFFEQHNCTVNTIFHLSSLFEKKPGMSLIAITTFQELGEVCSTSDHLKRAPDFISYCHTKLLRDSLESKAIDESIDTLRGQLMLSNQDLAHYIYLSFFQCLNKDIFTKYSNLTNCANITWVPETSILTQSLDENFRHDMITYYNKSTYLKTYIRHRSIYLSNITGYAPQDCTSFVYWAGQSNNVHHLLNNVNVTHPHICVSEDLSGLLDLAAIDSTSYADNPKDCVFGESKKIPVYRCEFLNKTYFVMVQNDILTHVWATDILMPMQQDWHMLTDTEITRNLSYKEVFTMMPTLGDQLKVSRHEYFNPKLPVFNLVLDLDLHITTSERGINEIYNLCCMLRGLILETIQILGSVDIYTHPVYFFKSSCEKPENWSGDQQLKFCYCTKKLGFRIITPLPTGVVLLGSDPVISIVNILNRTIKIDKQLVDMYPLIMETEGPFDVGIYHRGRCVRIPHTYKVNSSGRLERLLKLFVCHPHVPNKLQYVMDSLNINNLLYHSQNPGSLQHLKVIYDIRDINENFILQRAQELLPRTNHNVAEKIESVTNMSVTDWVTDFAWPKFFELIKLYFSEEKVSQFYHVSFVASTGNIIKIIPLSGNFSCLNFKHKLKTQSVRIFLSLHLTTDNSVTLTLMSQCFASKCNNNKCIAHMSIRIPINDK
ncbi:primase [Ateline gammaherpesvirus 3]|uniref:Primase n=1 Tax=Ateline herpesvirus 3 TaxID=85618 RepID=Q9YTL0_ATHV3|nr:primase [Ateline gammaherpesvirus 3]AAC95581.1 primase [Ateline gammaherpesvirus 3]